MSKQSVEERLETLEELVGKQKDYIETLEKKLTQLEDIEAIKRLQKAYGYYVEHMMKDEIIDCFADGPGVHLNWIEGGWLGKEGVKRYFGYAGNPANPPGFSHQLMPTAGIITVEPDGMKAKGRWYGFGGIFYSEEGVVNRGTLTSGIYEVGYVKEDGIWKIQSFDWIIPYVVRIDGLCEGPEIRSRRILNGEFGGSVPLPEPNIPMDEKDLRYVSGYIFPFHYRHPVTGKESSEAVRNAKLKPLKME